MVHPVKAAIFGAITDRCAPDLASADGRVEVLVILARMVLRVQDVMGLADDVVTAVLADAHKVLIDVDNAPVHVSN